MSIKQSCSTFTREHSLRSESRFEGSKTRQFGAWILPGREGLLTLLEKPQSRKRTFKTQNLYKVSFTWKKNDWEGQKKTENWKSITSAFSWLFFSFLPYRQRGNRRKLRKHLEKSRGNAMWWTKLQNSTKIHVMDWAIQNATRWWYPIMAVRKIKISQIFCNEKKKYKCSFLSKERIHTETKLKKI